MAGTNHKQSPAVVFDFGGVLFDWNPFYLYRQFFNDDIDAVSEFLSEIEFLDWNTQLDGGRPFAETISEVSARYPHYAELIQMYDSRWIETLGKPIQGTVDILNSLKAAGYPLYALSNWSAEKFKLVRPLHSFLKEFDEIVISGEVKLLKPDPQMFQYLLDRCGREAKDCLFIDDHLPNIETANKMGFGTIQFRSPAQLKEEIIRLGLL